MIITFNGTSSDSADFDIISVTRVLRPISPGARARMLEVTGRPGAYYFGKDRRPLTPSAQFKLKSTSFAARREAAREIAAWLDTDEPKPLVFSDEDDKRYNAVLVEPISFEEVALRGTVDVSFLVPEGFAEAVSVKNETGTGPHENEGTLTCPCTIGVELTGSTGSLKVELDETGEFIEIDQALVDQDYVKIDTEKRTVELNDANIRDKVKVESDFFLLPVGNFSLTVTPASTVGIVYRERWK